MDIYPDAVGKQWCDSFERAVPAKAPAYLSFLERVIKKRNIDLVIPGIEQDIESINKNIDRLKKLKAVFVLNNAELLKISADKWLLFQTLGKYGFKTIKSSVIASFTQARKELGLPMLMKPRRSYASKGIQLIESKDDYDYWKKKMGDNFMIQEIVGTDSEEYTCGIFGFGDGTCSKGINFRRVLSREGATAKAWVVKNSGLEKSVMDLVRTFKPIGPTNFQFRKHKGKFLLLEINPRISSSTSLRTAFGMNEAEMCITFFLKNNRSMREKIKAGHAVRYIEDTVTYDRNYF
jgi:carbamoyl-phosphate synthase large subunit